MPPSPSPAASAKKTWSPLILGSIVIGGAAVLVLLVAVLSISRDSAPFAARSFQTGAMPAVDMEESPSPLVFRAEKAVPPMGAPTEDRETIGPKIIKNGFLRIRVDNMDARLEEIKTSAASLNGYVDESTMREDAGIKTANLVLRVPSGKFDEMVRAVKKSAALVLEESSNAEDVTAVFVDVQARLRAAKAEEAQYLEILKQARTVEDTLRVTERLGEVRARIEQMEGQLRFLSDRTEYATLRVTLTEEARVEVPTRTWKPLETIRQTLRSLVVALQSLADILIAAAIFAIGYLLPLAIVVWMVYRLIRTLWRFIARKR